MKKPMPQDSIQIEQPYFYTELLLPGVLLNDIIWAIAYSLLYNMYLLFLILLRERALW